MVRYRIISRDTSPRAQLVVAAFAKGDPNEVVAESEQVTTVVIAIYADDSNKLFTHHKPSNMCVPAWARTATWCIAVGRKCGMSEETAHEIVRQELAILERYNPESTRLPWKLPLMRADLPPRKPRAKLTRNSQGQGSLSFVGPQPL